MDSGVKNIIESLIFASEEELTSKQVKDILDSFSFKISIKDVDSAVEEINKEYHDLNKPFEIIKIAGGYQFATRKDYALYVGKLFTEKQKKKLSQSSIETLAIIAYKQPITRSEIEFIRGVNVDYIVNSLLERDLITISGRADAPGRPILYSTTKNFLKVLGLNSVDDLPKLKEINEILRTEKIEGITEADIDLFNSINNPTGEPEAETDEIPIEFPQENEVIVSEEEGGPENNDDLEDELNDQGEDIEKEEENDPAELPLNEDQEDRNEKDRNKEDKEVLNDN